MTGRRPTRAATALGVASIAAFLALPVGGVAQAVVFLGLLAVATALLVGRVVGRRDLGGAWWWLVSGLVVYLVASAAWYALPVVAGRRLPFPSLVDPLFFTSYLLFGVFLVRVAGQRNASLTSRERRITLVDASILAAAAFAVSWVWIIRPNLEVDVSTLGKLVAAIYPTLTALLLGLALPLLLVGGRRRPVEWLLIAWVAGELVGDVFYGYATTNGSFTYGSPQFVPWLISYGALAALATHPDTAELGQARSTRPPGAPRRRLVVLLGATVIPLVLSIASAVEGDAVETTGTLIAAWATFALVIVRLTLVSGDLEEQHRLGFELTRLSGELEHGSRHDPLTGLGNRALLTERLAHAVQRRPSSPGYASALLLLDIDGFKTINETLGHETGDAVLVEVARRLQTLVRLEDTIARLGGDEFALVLEQVDPDQILRISRRILDLLREPVALHGRLLPVRSSIGICMVDEGGDPTTALRRADLAMYAAKDHGGNRYELFATELHQTLLARHRTDIELSEATVRGELRLHYQPIVDLSTGAVTGAEALLRWEHPERGLLDPGSFLGAAERSGSIIELGRWALDTACEQLMAWRVTGGLPANFQVSVNLSRRQLLDPNLVDDLRKTLARRATDPGDVILEITESALVADTDLLIGRLQELRQLGCTLAMDDFGTGYSSLDQLRCLPVDILKIHRSLVAGIDRGAADFELLAAIAKLAARLDKRTLGMGVETPAQFAHLRALDVELAQGFLFARPMLPEEFAASWRTAVPAIALEDGSPRTVPAADAASH